MTVLTHLVTRHRVPRKGYVLVIVAIIMAAVAVVSAGALLSAMSEFKVAQSTSREIQARTATEGTLDLAAWQVKEHLRRIPGQIQLPVSTTPGTTNSSILELSSVEAQATLTDASQPWVGVLGFPATRSNGQVFIGQEEIPAASGIDDSTILSDIQGPSDQRLLEFLDDSSFVQRRLEYLYHPGEATDQINVVAYGEVRKGTRDIRTSTLRKSYDRTTSYYGDTERTRDDFSIMPDRMPVIESPHDLSVAAIPQVYPQGMDRDWVVSYPVDPNNPGRKIKRIGLVFADQQIGLEDAGDFMDFSVWDSGRFNVPFSGFNGPTVLGGSTVFTDAGTDSTSMRIHMLSDTNTGTGTPAEQFGFKLSGIQYWFDSEEKSAYFETPHPYANIEGGAFGPSTYVQTVWSPFNLTEEDAGNVVIPGDGNGDPFVVDPIGPGSGSDPTDPVNPTSIIQKMRLEFAPNSFLEPGDVLYAVNANNGQILATYTGAFGLATTPYATRVRANTPLGIQLKLAVDGTSLTPDSYGFLVSAIEYVNDRGQLVREDLPEQETAHTTNLGSTEFSTVTDGRPWETTIFMPTAPGGVPINSWTIHFNRSTDLDAQSANDADYVRIEYLTTGGPITPAINYANPNGSPGAPFPLGYDDIINISNATLTLTPLIYAVKITPFLDEEGANSSARENYGFWVDSLTYTANNANDIDVTSGQVATIQAFGRTAEYPDFGSEPSERGDWWVTVPNVTEVGLHFTREEFRLEGGDAIDIFDLSGNLIATMEASDDGGIIAQPGSGGGVVGELIADPNIPGWLDGQFGWVLVPGDTAHIVLRGDGGTNRGYNGFIMDRVAYFSNTFLANSDRPVEDADPANFNRRTTSPLTGFGEVGH